MQRKRKNGGSKSQAPCGIKRASTGGPHASDAGGQAPSSRESVSPFFDISISVFRGGKNIGTKTERVSSDITRPVFAYKLAEITFFLADDLLPKLRGHYDEIPGDKSKLQLGKIYCPYCASEIKCAKCTGPEGHTDEDIPF